MKIHYLQHILFEDLANIETWAQDKGHEISKTLLFNGENPPIDDDFDFIIIMGGPMNIYEEDKYPWLAYEKEFIKKQIESDKIVLGICLGAQLIADVLGGTIIKNKETEIGWFNVKLYEDANKSDIFSLFPKEFLAFHWHGDAISLPPKCLKIAKSDACEIQAFEYNNGKVIGLQFHLESTIESVEKLIKHCSDEIVDGKYIQTANQMMACGNMFTDIESMLYMLLDSLEDKFID
jgi:GMP synthase-like glutamine amidotransferase